MAQTYKGTTIPAYADTSDGVKAFQDFVDNGGAVSRVTSAARPAAPQTGQLIFNITDARYEYWTGSAWVPLGPPSTRCGFRAGATGLVSVPNATNYVPTYTTEFEDTHNIFNPTTGIATITTATAGVWSIQASVQMENPIGNVNALFSLWISSTTPGTTDMRYSRYGTASWTQPLVAGDTVRALLFHEVGASYNMAARIITGYRISA